jgi:hypothetical protein
LSIDKEDAVEDHPALWASGRSWLNSLDEWLAYGAAGGTAQS